MHLRFGIVNNFCFVTNIIGTARELQRYWSAKKLNLISGIIEPFFADK